MNHPKKIPNLPLLGELWQAASLTSHCQQRPADQAGEDSAFQKSILTGTVREEAAAFAHPLTRDVIPTPLPLKS